VRTARCRPVSRAPGLSGTNGRSVPRAAVLVQMWPKRPACAREIDSIDSIDSIAALGGRRAACGRPGKSSAAGMGLVVVRCASRLAKGGRRSSKSSSRPMAARGSMCAARALTHSSAHRALRVALGLRVRRARWEWIGARRRARRSRAPRAAAASQSGNPSHHGRDFAHAPARVMRGHSLTHSLTRSLCLQSAAAVPQRCLWGYLRSSRVLEYTHCGLHPSVRRR
jgi:hypothetical protein